MGQAGMRYSWNWNRLPARHGAGGDLYPVLLLLRPYFDRYQWRVEEMDATGPGISTELIAGSSLLSMENLLSIFVNVQQVIDGRVVGTMPGTGEYIEVSVVDNTHLDIQGASSAVVEYCESMFGPPEAVVNDG